MIDGIQGGRGEAGRTAAPPWSTSSNLPRTLAVIVVVIGIAVAAASVASGQPQRSSAQPPWIVFTAHPSGHGVEQVFRVKQSGEGLKQLTRGNYSSAAPAFSPDGKRIAFVRLGTGILSMNLDGTGVRRLTSNGRDNLPVWSPDGKQIAFIRPSAKGWSVFVMSASGSGERQLRLAPPAGRPTWNASGLIIPSEGDLARINPQSGRVFRWFGATIDAIVGTNTTAIAPNLSTITYVGAAPQDPGDKDCGDGIPCPRFALYIEDIRKHKAPRIHARDAGPASFSPDGKRLAYVTRNRIVLSVIASGAAKSITTGNAVPGVSTPPVWQPR
jgi:Tol biopolymer transport system component